MGPCDPKQDYQTQVLPQPQPQPAPGGAGAQPLPMPQPLPQPVVVRPTPKPTLPPPTPRPTRRPTTPAPTTPAPTNYWMNCQPVRPGQPNLNAPKPSTTAASQAPYPGSQFVNLYV